MEGRTPKLFANIPFQFYFFFFTHFMLKPSQALVLNTLANQQWQHEERPPGFPLGYGQPTQITALTSDHSFDIFGKNQQQFSYCYRHRYDVSRINQVQFSGQGTVVKAYIGRVCVCVCVCRLEAPTHHRNSLP